MLVLKKITVDESNKGGVNSEFNEQQKARISKTYSVQC